MAFSGALRRPRLWQDLHCAVQSVVGACASLALAALLLGSSPNASANPRANEAKELPILFGVPAKLMRRDPSAGTYTDEKQFFRATGPFALEISRDPEFIALGTVFFHVQVLSAVAAQQPVMEATVAYEGLDTVMKTFDALPTGPYLVKIRVDAELQKLMASNLFPGRVEPPPRPYSFLVRASSLTGTGTMAPAQEEEFNQKIAGLSSCTSSATDMRPSIEVERVATISAAAAANPVPTVRLFSGGPLVYLHVPISWLRTKHKAYLTVLAKGFGDAEYRSVCAPLLLSPGTRLVVARSTSTQEWLNWRVEVSFQKDGVKIPSADAIVVERQRFLSPPPVGSGSPGFDKSFAFMCTNKPTNTVTPAGQTKFSQSFHLDVRLADSGTLLSEAQRREVRNVALHSAATWTRACTTCQPLNLSFISLDGQNYAHSAIAQWADGRQTLALDADFIEMSMRVAKGENRIGTIGITFEYQPVGDIGKAFQQVCKLPATKDRPNLSSFQQRVCGVQKIAPEYSTSIIIRFAPGKNACGDSANIIACRADHELTEFNSRDFKFVFDNPAVPSIGHGRVEIDFSHALLHEMGHWIGLQHLDDGHSIMASSLGRSRCVDESTVSALGKVVSGEPARATSPLAFTLRDTTKGRVQRSPSAKGEAWAR